MLHVTPTMAMEILLKTIAHQFSRNIAHKWGYLASPLCDCGEPQTMRHMIDDCPLSHLDGGIKALHLAEDPAVNWIMDFKTRST